MGTAVVNAAQHLFLSQARSDLKVFELLRAHHDLPPCHALHYLQMSTELFGKAHAWRHGRPRQTHRAFVGFLRTLSTNRRAQKHIGYERRNEQWAHLIRKSVPLAEQIEDLAPSLARDLPNPEYPWPPDDPQMAPVGYEFSVWIDLKVTPAGSQFLNLLRRLFSIAETFL